MKTELVETYNVDKNGKAVLLSTETIELQGLSNEELIAEKETQLLAMYAELELLKK